MTAENVELIEHVFSTWNEGDPEGFMEPYAQDAVLETPPNFPEGGTVQGHAAIREFFMSVREGWVSGTSVDVRELRPVEDDRVLAQFVWSGTGESSGIEAHFDTLVLFTIREGKVARAQFFLDHAAGLSAAGLAD